METKILASRELADEIGTMVMRKEFLDEKKEFLPLTEALVARNRNTDSDAWSLVTGKIVEFLPDCIPRGIIHHSLVAIGEQQACRQAVLAGEKELLVRPGDGFPAIPFGTFYPYLEFFLRAGPVDLLRMKTRFKVEGKVSLRDAKILFSGDRVKNISGSMAIAVKISLRTDTHDVQLHQFEKIIRVE
jgi:hypothetical protein